MLQGRV